MIVEDEEMKPEVRFRAAGDRHLVAELADVIDPSINRRVVALAAALERQRVVGIIDLLPTYRSLLVHYDPLVAGRGLLENVILRAFGNLTVDMSGAGKRWRIPVVYGGAHGPDLDEVAARHGITTDEVIALHSGAEYRIFMIGFAPGYAYLGGLPPALHTPRRPAPRLSAPAGTISIGGQQASIASVPLPTGWNLLGRTPVKAFDPMRADPFLFAAGDTVAFTPVGQPEFERLQVGIERGSITSEAFHA
ncbi:allophanate hydrolase [Agaricicola taiwanensis]|uniref:Allophanate hydrolase n=1 Tax=Agaricicola taiwanensis TaxID=591372 RepID=A0A8J3DXJ4_9RHOB|nr:5-oxoprolinase subunit PxpB [Agaricicola taiwanensis]GGE48497.1 allophanate hydrolase [Agaricicola taiwanensis]